MQIEVKENEVTVTGITINEDGIADFNEDVEHALMSLGAGKFTFIFRKEDK